MGKVLKAILSVFAVCIVGYVCFCYIAHKSFDMYTENLYIYHGDGGNSVLETSDDGTVTIYKYSTDNNKGNVYVYGVQTTYKYYGSYYNQLLFHLHVYPSLDWRVWDGYAFYDDSKEQRARVTLKVKNNKGLFVTDNYERDFGESIFDVIVKEDSIQFGEQIFTKLSGYELNYVKSIIEFFHENAK